MKRLAWLALVLVAITVAACTNADGEQPASTQTAAPSTDLAVPPADQISSGPASWTTAPPWDCKGTPPAGYISQFPDSNTCVLVPAPSCPPVVINGRSYCGPEDATSGGSGPGAGPTFKTAINLGDSTVIWQTDADGVSTIVEWKVQEADSAAFVDLHRAFYEDVSGQPTLTPGPTPPKSPGASR